MPTSDPTTPVPSAEPVARLLVVEDDLDQQELVAETLADQFGDDAATIVGSCEAALDLDVSQFDLILCDVNLPDGNGLDLLAIFQERAPSVPVMMLTGENDTAFAREAIKRGAVDYVVKSGSYLITMPLTVEKNLAAGSLVRERQSAAMQLQTEASRLANDLAAVEKQRANIEANLRQAEQEASTDPMTGCYNRRAFERVFAQLFAEAYRGGGQLVCVMVDLDKFKQVNDTLGHSTGDALIQAAARSITANLRQMDVACRYGGDEFILLLPATTPGSAASVCDRIRRDYAAASAALLNGEPKTMSIGIAGLQQGHPRAASPEVLMEATDRALYQAKEAGRDQICCDAA